MAKNDMILLDGIIDQRVADRLPSEARDEVFEYFVLEQALKEYDLAQDEIEFGWVDGGDDGGIDGIYVFINGHLLEDPAEFSWPRSSASIDVWIFTCKHHSTFKQATLDAALATIQEFFDFSVADSELHGQYSPELLDARSRLQYAYRKLSIGRPELRFVVVYGSRGDSAIVGDSVVARSNQIQHAFESLFSSATAEFLFIGATELVEMHRKSRSFCLDLPFVEHLATERSSYVLLVRLEDYWRFVSDETGALRRYLFDSNVRDFLGTYGVNDDIAKSLQDESAPDFWWLNNGVTILATGATIPGKTIQLQDIQIVNGLQTTETIYRHFQSGATSSRHRSVLVKVVVSSDAAVRDRIIRATNNQSPVELAALHATDKIQRDIEDILERQDWYYERRRNYYRNIGKPPSRFVTPIYLASAAVALVLKNPQAATKLRTKFMRTREGYESVFSDSIPIEVWPVLAEVFKSVDSLLSSLPHPHRRGERFLKNWRALVALLIVARRLGTFAYPTARLLEITKVGPISASELDAAWEIVTAVQEKYDGLKQPRPSFFASCCEESSVRYGLEGHTVVGRRGIGAPSRVDRTSAGTHPTPEFLDQVDSVLPAQPWKPGVHADVARQLDCKQSLVYQAIQVLIASGRRNVQKDGVVYDASGKVIARDASRVVDDRTEAPADKPTGE